MRRNIGILLTLVTLSNYGAPDRLTKEEKNLASYLAQQQSSALSLLSRLVNINSGTDNIEGVKAVGEILEKELDQLGFTTQWIEEPKEFHRAGTLIAKHRGRPHSKRILLIGHLDTVYPENSPFQGYAQQGRFATGPGVVDDKGGDVVMLYALKALYQAGLLEQANITVVLTGDEENSGKPTSISRQPLIDLASETDVALDFELAISLDTATIARRGVSEWGVTAFGKEAHSSDIFEQDIGYGAIFELSRIINEVREELGGEPYVTFNPGIILGGTQVEMGLPFSPGTAYGSENVVPQMAIARGDFRFSTDLQKRRIERKIRAVVKKHLPGTNASIEFKEGIPAMSATPNNVGLLKKYSQVSMDLGQGHVRALDAKFRGAGDISYVASLVPASLSGLGPYGTGIHSTTETLDVNSLIFQMERATILIYRLTQEQ